MIEYNDTTFYFLTLDEYYKKKGLLEWLHTCVAENIKGNPYDHFYYSDGSSSWAYKGKDNKWMISKHMDRVTFELNNEYVLLFTMRFC